MHAKKTTVEDEEVDANKMENNNKMIFMESCISKLMRFLINHNRLFKFIWMKMLDLNRWARLSATPAKFPRFPFKAHFYSWCLQEKVLLFSLSNKKFVRGGKTIKPSNFMLELQLRLQAMPRLLQLREVDRSLFLAFCSGNGITITRS